MNTIKINAYAKVNFTLDITGKTGEYHELDSLVCTVDLCDKVVIKKRKDKTCTVKMHGQNSETLSLFENNAYKAAIAFLNEFQTSGADIVIYKNIPMGAGLGGSSTDAAAVLKGLSRLYQIDDEIKIKRLADELGSDTGYLLKGGFARLKGRGEKIESLSDFYKLHLFVLLPSSGVATPACYKKYDEQKKEYAPKTQEAVSALLKGDLSALGAACKNDLYAAAKELNNDVGLAYTVAQSFCPSGAAMTGSGSGVFALFETEELCAYCKSRYQGEFSALVLKTVKGKE